jgi:protein SCO1
MTHRLIIIIAILFNTSLYATEIPKDSIYQFASQWQNQNGKSVELQSLAGNKQIISLIYTHCLHTCPTIVSTMKAIESQLKDAKKEAGFVLVSLSPDSDTPKILKEFAEVRELSESSWTLLTGTASDVRSLAMLLNIKYKATEDNEIAHSNVFTVVDEKGRIIFQEKGRIDKATEAAERIIAL